MRAHFILYVADQVKSTEFYASVLGRQPTLSVPGMAEFELDENAVLGLMPAEGIVRLLGDAIPHPGSAVDIARAELYLIVDEPESYHSRAIAAGARELSPLTARDWGHAVAYSLDPDGYVLAFAAIGNDSK